MSLWLLPVSLLLAGPVLWAGGHRATPGRSRLVLGVGGAGALAVATVAAVVATLTSSTADYPVGAGLVLQVAAGPIAGPVAVLVAAIGTVVTMYAASHEGQHVDGDEDGAGLARLVGLLVAFVGAMLLVVLAADLLSLTVGWELVGAVSWALIGHDWRDAAAPGAAAHAYNATRFGGLGLVLAAGAAFATTGSLGYDALGGVDGVALHVMVAGVLLAAVSKSALLPFSPWLFSAMAGPTSVSALLHSSTMVAAGAYALIRLQPALEAASWFGPVAIGIGLVTALAGGVVGLVQGHAKKLLAASTSAQYGLMVVAVGAGAPEVAGLHLVAHAVFKAQLFLSAGVAITAVGSHDLARMRLRGVLPWTTRLTLVATLALAAVPPLGAAYTKEQVLAAGTHAATWIGLLVAVAGGLSAAYATRFQVLAFGGARPDRPSPRPLVRHPAPVELVALAVLAAASVTLGLLWVPAVHDAVLAGLGETLPEARPWELPVSIGLVAAGGYVVWSLDRRGRLGHVPTGRGQQVVADWFALPRLVRVVVVAPTRRLASALATADGRLVDFGVDAAGGLGQRLSRVASGTGEMTVDRVVRGVARTGTVLADAGVRVGERGVERTVGGVAWLARRAGDDVRRTQTGFVHHQYVVIAVGLVVVIAAAILGR